jgi:hypothetical protein
MQAIKFSYQQLLSSEHSHTVGTRSNFVFMHGWDSADATSGGRTRLALTCVPAASEHSRTTTRLRALVHFVGALGHAVEAHICRSSLDSPHSRAVSGPRPLAQAVSSSRARRRQHSRASSQALARAAANTHARHCSTGAGLAQTRRNRARRWTHAD